MYIVIISFGVKNIGTIGTRWRSSGRVRRRQGRQESVVMCCVLFFITFLHVLLLIYCNILMNTLFKVM